MKINILYEDERMWARIARAHLVQARFWAQRAELAKDNFTLFPDDNVEMRMYFEDNKLVASHHRKSAKDALQKYEKIVGQLYVSGDRFLPLKDRLNGRNFTQWPEYGKWLAEILPDTGDIWI